MNQELMVALAAAAAAIEAGQDYTTHITQDQLNKFLIIQLRNRYLGDPATP